jgi:hypothetical protein
MAIRIPTATRQVDINTPNLSVGVPAIARPPEEAFGGGVIEANNDLAKNFLGALQKRAQERVDFENKQFDDQVEMSYLNELNNQLFSEDEKSVIQNGKKLNVTAGVLNRKGILADNTLAEFDKWNTERLPKILQSIPDGERRSNAYNKLYGYYQSKRGDVVKHQIKEVRDYREKTAVSSIALRSQMAAQAKTPEEINFILDDIAEKRDNLDKYLGVDENTNILNKQKDAEGALSAAIGAQMITDPTGESARAILEGYKDKIGADAVGKINRLIDSTVIKNSIDLENNLYDKFNSGDLTLEEVYSASSLDQKQGGIGGKKGRIFLTALHNRQAGKIKDLREDNESASEFLDLVDSVVSDDVDLYNIKNMVIKFAADHGIDQRESILLSKVKEDLLSIRDNRKIMSNKIKGEPSGLAMFWGPNWWGYGIDKLKEWHARNNPSDGELTESIRYMLRNYDNVKDDDDANNLLNNIISRQQQKINLNAGKYTINQVIPTDRGSFEVVGFDDDGEPLVRVAR